MAAASGQEGQLGRQHWSNASARREPQISPRKAAGGMRVFEHIPVPDFQFGPTARDQRL